MDKYSLPICSHKTKLGIKFLLNSRRNPDKPGRELVVPYDFRFPLIQGFNPTYIYYVRIFEQGSVAGNHYHKKKKEIFVPISGNFELFLKSVITDERERHSLNSLDNVAFYIPTRVAHTIVPSQESGVFLVLATSPNTEDDEFKYVVRER